MSLKDKKSEYLFVEQELSFLWAVKRNRAGLYLRSPRAGREYTSMQKKVSSPETSFLPERGEIIFLSSPAKSSGRGKTGPSGLCF